MDAILMFRVHIERSDRIIRAFSTLKKIIFFNNIYIWQSY